MARVKAKRLAGQLLQHFAHSLMKHIDGFQWPDHNLELDDLSLFVKGHDIDAIDHDAIDLALKLQHRVVTGDNFLGIAKALIEHMHSTGQIRSGDFPAFLWRVDDRGEKHAILGENFLQSRWIAISHYVVPYLYRIQNLFLPDMMTTGL